MDTQNASPFLETSCQPRICVLVLRRWGSGRRSQSPPPPPVSQSPRNINKSATSAKVLRRWGGGGGGTGTAHGTGAAVTPSAGGFPTDSDLRKEISFANIRQERSCLWSSEPQNGVQTSGADDAAGPSGLGSGSGPDDAQTRGAGPGR